MEYKIVYSETFKINLMSFQPDLCNHLSFFRFIPASYRVCKKCQESGDIWVSLRVCQQCGEVSCCNSSINKHATQHFIETGHPVVISAEPGEYWAYCYRDDIFMEYSPDPVPDSTF